MFLGLFRFLFLRRNVFLFLEMHQPWGEDYISYNNFDFRMYIMEKESIFLVKFFNERQERRHGVLNPLII
jgi:hypothetical protein